MSTPSGWSLWLTGLPASGKTTLARAIRQKLSHRGITSVILDSDEVRHILTPDPTYTHAERDRFYAALVKLAALLTDYDINVIIAATGSRRAYRRQAAHDRLSPFAEVWVRCPLKVCRRRDPKDLYSRAEAGEITTLPGVGEPYEPPLSPDVIVDTHRQTPEEAAGIVLAEVPFLTPGRE